MPVDVQGTSAAASTMRRPGTESVAPSSVSSTPRRWRRGRSLFGPSLLYLLLAALVLAPFFPKTFRDAGDLYAVVGGTVEARSALLEGQFPIRVPPHALDGVRYPIFQFYGNLPFTAAGLVYTVLPVNPYAAWKVTAALSMACGALFVYLLARRLTRRPLASVLAGVLFMTSPYMFADIVARGAYTEFFAFNLLPVVLYFAWRAYDSSGIRFVAASAITWGLLGLCHNITYLYGVTLIGSFFVLLFLAAAVTRPGRSRRLVAGASAGRRPRDTVARHARGLARVTLAGVLHLPLVLWYIAPQLAVVQDLIITARFTTPMEWARLTTLHSLLQPFAFTPAASTTPDLTLQVGPPLLIAFVLALVVMLRRGTRVRHRRVIACLAILFVLAFVTVWSPADFWRYLPRQLGYVQFPYRVLMFVVLFGSLLAAYGFGLLRSGGRSLRAGQLLVVLAGVGVVVGTYVPRTGIYYQGVVEKQTADPKMGGLEDYQFLMSVLAPTSRYHPDLNFANPEWGLAGREFLRPDRHWVISPANVAVPTPTSASAVRVEGVLPPESGDAADLVVLLGESSYLERLLPGPFTVFAPVTIPLNGQPVRLAVYAVPSGATEKPVPVKLTKIAFEHAPVSNAATTSPTTAPATPGLTSAAVEYPPLLTGEALRPKVRYGRRTKCAVSLDRTTLIQLPVLYYRGLLTVRDNGQSIPYGNLGRFVALELGPGAHKLDVTFTGLPWANAVSLAGWSLVGGMLLVPWVRRRVASRRPRTAAADASAPRRRVRRFGPAAAVTGCAAVVLGGLAAEAAFRASRAAGWDVRAKIAAAGAPDNNEGPAGGDTAKGGPATAPGGTEPITLTLEGGVSARVSASRAGPPDLAIEHAFDGNPSTAWAGGGSNPVSLRLDLARPATPAGIELTARQTSLNETWHKVRVVLWRDGQRVFEREFPFNRAHLEPLQSIDLAATPTPADRIDLHFSDRVLVTPDNKRIGADLVNPGYSEIRLRWAE